MEKQACNSHKEKKKSIEKQQIMRRLAPPDVKTCYKASLIKTA